MQAPGLSLRDLLDIVRKCRDVYEAFQHPHRNAASRAVDFRNDVGRARESLQEIKQHEEKYPGEEAFKKTLEECDDYWKSKMNALVKRHEDGEKSNASRAQILRFVFDNKTIGLYQKLMYNRQDFLDWKMGQLWKISSNRGEQSTATPAPSCDAIDIATSSQNISPNIQAGEASSKQLQDASVELVKLIYSYSNLTNGVAVSGAGSKSSAPRDTESVATEVDHLNVRLWTTVDWICRLTELPRYYRPLPISLNHPPGRFMPNIRHLATHGSADVVRYSGTSSMPLSRRVSIRIHVPHFEKIKGHTLNAKSYLVSDQKCIFHDVEGRRIFEHRWRSDCHPVTFNESLPKNTAVFFLNEPKHEQRFSTFNGKGDVSKESGWLPKPSKRQIAIRPEYVIDSLEDRKLFQEDLRDMDLLYESSVGTISFGQDAVSHSVAVQLWRERTGSRLSCISFPAGKPWTWQECALSSFNVPEEASNVVRLPNKQPPGANSPSSLSRRSAGSADNPVLSEFLQTNGDLKLKFDHEGQAERFVDQLKEAMGDLTPSAEQNGNQRSPSTVISSPMSPGAASSTDSPTTRRTNDRRDTNGSTSSVGTSPIAPMLGQALEKPSQLPPPAKSSNQAEWPLDLGQPAINPQEEVNQPARSDSHHDLPEQSPSCLDVGPSRQTPTDILTTYQVLRSGSVS